MPRNALGRGLGALIREAEPQLPAVPAASPTSGSPAAGAAVVPAREPMSAGPQHIDIDLVEPSPFQPRTRFREEALDELARSIKASGIIQPLVVRPVGSRYQLIAGERRWRAAQRAGLSKVSVIIRQVSDELALEMTLVENIQREDLNPIEAARAFDRLMREFQLTQEVFAARTQRCGGNARSPGRQHSRRAGRTAKAPGHKSLAARKNEDASRPAGAGVLRRRTAHGSLRSPNEIIVSRDDACAR